jgi:hypothetical protein
MSRPGAVVLPHPPLLVPQMTGPGAVAAEALREACTAAVRSVIESAPSLVLLVGPGRVTRRHPDDAWGTLAGYGVPVEAPRTPRADTRVPELPLSLTLGRWLLDEAGHHGRLLLQEVSADEPAARCARLGAQLATELADRYPDAVWLVLSDLSTKRTDRAPGAFDPRAQAFDERIERALRQADPRQILELDPGIAAELGASGRSALQVFAGGWAARAVAGRVTAAVDYSGAPYGVGYVVARWGHAAVVVR